jgi:capsular exopolysaccharide synthesis family protein
MRFCEHSKHPSPIHTVFQEATETWLQRPRRSDFDGGLVHLVASRIGSQSTLTTPLVLAQANENHQRADAQEATDNDQSMMADQTVTVPASARRRQVTPVRQGLDQRLLSAHQPISAIAEQYRKLYVEIVHAGQAREFRVLLLSSALAGEGKTFSAVNLALTMAASGSQHNVLLIDADFRKPSIHTLLGTSPHYGLADYLLGEVPYAEIFMQTEVSGLTVVYAGRQVENPTVLLSPEKIGRFFQDLKGQEQYGYIIVDSSPILLTSEPRALVQYVDAALLVVRAGHTPRRTINQAIETLGREHIHGCVFNGVTKTDWYYYHHYYSGYYQQQQH